MFIDSHREVSVGLTHAILEALRMEGVANPEALLPEAGIDPDLLAKPENRIPFERQNALWALAVSSAPEPAFGLQFARSVQPTRFGVVGYMAMNCGSIGECLEAIVDYQFLAGEGGEFSLEPCGSDTALCYNPVKPRRSGHPRAGGRHARRHRQLRALAGGQGLPAAAGGFHP
jgi:hypothetical protein